MIENFLTLLSCIYVQIYDCMNDNYFLCLIDHAFIPNVIQIGFHCENRFENQRSQWKPPNIIFFPFFHFSSWRGEGSATTCYLPLSLNFLTYLSHFCPHFFGSNIIFHFFLQFMRRKRQGVWVQITWPKKRGVASHDMTIFLKK